MPKSSIKCSLYEGKGVRILKRVITTRKGKFEVFDVEMRGIAIIKDCRLVHGKHGDFISTPSKEVNGDYYPQAYIAPKIADMLIEILTEEDFKKTSLKYLSFNDDEDEDDEDEDEDDEDEDEDDEDEDENASNRKRRRR